jgi:hypothetical protein
MLRNVYSKCTDLLLGTGRELSFFFKIGRRGTTRAVDTGFETLFLAAEAGLQALRTCSFFHHQLSFVDFEVGFPYSVDMLLHGGISLVGSPCRNSRRRRSITRGRRCSRCRHQKRDFSNGDSRARKEGCHRRVSGLGIANDCWAGETEQGSGGLDNTARRHS